MSTGRMEQGGAATEQSRAVTVDLVAQNIVFNKKTITVPAGAAVTIKFVNKDDGVPHNFALYEDSTAAKSIYVGKIISGVSSITYRFTAPQKPGNYFFRCDVHAMTMYGTFVVEAA